uniref:BRCA2 DNA repair associated n=1 Tax=Anser cygnoides TaxID=8845 RepID=A0A8B9ETQ5_ANSCY|nr:breast cancer type 2 susceptibility protein [Anser cygnoides]
MACRSVERPTFFEIFKTRCSDSDLGPISLNWFEELSSEAPPYEPKLLGELDGPIDQTSFKTPKAKHFTYSQLASTPPIFKEQNTIMPPFSSPGRELDQKKIGTSRENFTSPSIIGRKRDQENEILASPLGTCHNFLAASPAILRNAYRTPQRSNIPGPYGSLFCTPKFLEVRTPKRISESLGAEVDPDMSWSSSLATPPTLGATVIIARETDSISGLKQQDERAEIVLHNFSSDHDECPGKNDTSLLSVPETVQLNAEDVTKDFESEMLDGFFGEMDSFEDTLNVPAESSGALLLQPRALDATDKCEIRIDEAQGEGDVPSEQPVRRKTGISQEVEMAKGAEKSHPIEMKDSLFQNADEDTGDSKDVCLIGHEKELDLLRITGNVQDNRAEKSCENEKLVKEDVLSSSSQWSQLNLSGLDVTHLEMSTCSSPSFNLCTDKDLKEKTALMTKDGAVETSLLNTLGLKNAQQLLNASLSEKHEETQKTENNPTAEVTPVKSVRLNPELVKGCAAEKVSKMSFINCNSFLIRSTNVMEYSVVYNSSFSKCVKATSKSVVTDVLSHPLVCTTTSPDNCSDLRFTNSENTLTKSGFKSLNVLSRLKNKSKRFIYTINNTLLYQEEKIQKEVTSELPADLMLPHLETDSHEFQGCHVATDGDSDSLLSAERQPNIKEDNLSTFVQKDLVDNSSFNSGMEQQELRNSGKDARENQAATSLKCLEASNPQKEDKTDSLNSERISNIKRKVLSSACLMARKCSRLFPEDCYLEKGEEDTYVSCNVNDGATVPQSLKGQPAQSSPSKNDRLFDVCRDTTSVTNRDVNKTLSQINFGINRASSDSCNKISADKKHATDPLSVVEHRQVLAPLGINCSGNDRIRLKQWGKKDVAAFSGDVADNQETRSVKSDESPEAAACNNVAVEIVKELLDYVDDNSLIEVISEEDKQVPPMYSNKRTNENLEHEGKSSGIVNVCRSNLSFGGFQTASNKQIKFSEDSIAKGKMLFKDIENECFEASNVERVRNFSNQVQKENIFSSNLESKLGSNLSGSQTRHTQFTPHKVDLCKNFPRSLHSLQELNQTLTASQEAEIAEISSILEETGSQFEFTQFRRQSNVFQSVEKHDIVTVEMHGATNVENNSELGEDTDSCSTVKSENQVRNDKYCSTWKDTNEECNMVQYEKENRVLFHKSNEEVTFADRDESGISDSESFPIPVQASVSNFVGFTSAGGKKISISKAALTRSAELFKDLDDNYLFKSSETNTGCSNSKGGGMSSNWNSFRCLTKENKGVSNINSIGAISHARSVSHHSEKKYVGNVSTPEKENRENWRKRLISDDERVNFSRVNARHSTYGMRNSPTSIQKQNQNHTISKQVLNPGDCQAEDSLQEDSLYVTCLGDATATAEHCDLSVSDEMENLSPTEKGEDRRQKDERLPQKFQTSADDAAPISDGPLDNSLHGLSVNCGERDIDVSENSDKQKTNSINVEGEDTTHRSLFVNESRIKIGCYQHHQVPFEQEVVVEPSEVKGDYLTGFQTASGKKITIADGFLAKAEHFFSEDDVDLGKEHNDNFEDHLKNRKRSINCVKSCDLHIDNVAQCDAEIPNCNKKLIPEEPGIQFKQTRESSPAKKSLILDSVKVDAFVNVGEDGERNLVVPYVYEKADVHPGKSELEAGWESRALSRTCLSEDGELFAEVDVECSAKKKDKSENRHGFPVQSATSLPSVKVSSNPVDNSVPCDTKNTLFVEDSSKSNQSVLLDYSSVSQNNFSHLNSNSKEFDVKHLNQRCSNADCFTDTTFNAHQNRSEVGFPEGGTNLTRLQEASLNFNDGNPEGGLKQTVFSTAKGKAVFVSESALARVRQMFQEDYGESVKHEIKTKSRTNQMEIPGNSSSVVPAECPNSTKFLDATEREGNSAASHFIDGNVNAGENGQQDANPFADEVSVPNSQVQGFEQNTELLGNVPVPGKQVKQSDSSKSNLGFFSTASGKPVQLSEESLKKARQLFSEMESSHSSGLQEFLVEEDVEKSKKHTEEVFPRKMQLALPEERENASSKLISGPSFGFSTASGKQVTVSENAYQKAKAILKESDDFLSSKLCIIDQLHAIKESGQRTKSQTGKVISESRIDKSCNEELDFKSNHAEEMKSFSSTHHLEVPEYVPHSKKNNQLALFKNSFQQEETVSFRKGLNRGMKTESEAVSCSATAKAEIDDLFQTPKNHLKVGAVGNEKASVGDELADSGAKNSAQFFGGKTSDKNFQNKTFGKRHFEEKNSLGEPPIKRQLLLEFDKTKIPPRSLKASKSTPEGIFKDRRKFLYHIPLKPVTCQPFGATKERQEVKNPTLTLPDQDFKGFKSKPAIFQHCALRQSSNDASRFSTPHKASAQESEEKRNLYKSGKTAKTFVPPFKTKLTFSTSEQGSSRRCDSTISINTTEERELNQITIEKDTVEAPDDLSCIVHTADTDLENGNLVTSKMMANLRCARDLQEMRIKKKYRQNISSQPGSLYVIKTSARNRVSLKTAVEEKSPSFYSTEELYRYGVSKHCVQVNSTNAESFQFLIKDFFSKEYLLAGNGIQLADGGWLIPTDEGKAGKREFYRALCDTPGVDPKLITEAWAYNHYRWIVWKLAAMEVAFPHEFATRCLTPETVLLQLKYRYDLEIDKSKRSAIKKITERDDAAGKTLVLCVSKIISLNAVVSPSNNNMESKKGAAIIEVTDGWYGIRALLDPPIKAFLRRRRLRVGQKIIVHGAELVGAQNGCTPLEAPDSLMLKISANSTRCARWHAKLGFHRDPRPFPLPLSSLYSEGGAVGCIDVVIQRTYPIQWMEKTSAGSYVFRNSRAEEREAARHAEDQQKKLEALFAKIQAEFEKHEESASRKTPSSRVVTRQQIHNLQDGAELYEAIQNASDPGYMEGYLSEDQLKALNAHRQLMNDKKQTRIQEEFKKAVESAEKEKYGCSKRDVSTVWKLCVVDYRKQEKHKGVILSIWRPLLDVCSLLKEGSRYRIYQLSTSQSKGRAESTNIQLTATKKTQYLQLSVSQKMLLQIFFPRKALKFTSLLDPSFQPPCAEVDLVGVVVSVSKAGFATMVYLSDESYNLVAIKIWADLRHFAIEDIVVRCSFISASNLQWQSDFRSEIPVLVAGDLSVFSASPKETYLQEKFNELRSMVENVDSFCSDAESKLMNLLQRSHSLTPTLPKRCGSECFSPSCNSGLYAADKSSISSSKMESKHLRPLSTSTPTMKLVPQGSAKTPSSAATDEDNPKNSKKRKAMDFLSCIPVPPPLTPICSTISPSLKKAFQPPRSLGLQRSKSTKETNPNVGFVTPSRKVREAVRVPVNDLVADEELAMINTQALMNTLPEEKKTEGVNENSTIATNLSDDLSPKHSSRAAEEAKNLLKSSSEEAEALQKDAKELGGSLSTHRMLPRRKSRKCY